MRYIIRFFIINFSFFICYFSFGQNLILKYDNKPVNDSIVTVYIDINEPSATHIIATNQSANDIEVSVKKIENNVISGSENTFCWAGSCLPPATFESQRMTILAGATVDDFYGDYNAKGSLGMTSVTYLFKNHTDGDTAIVTINYIGTNVSVNSLKNEILYFSAYPNPADKVLNIQFSVPRSQFSDYTLILNNMTGAFSSQSITRLGEASTLPLHFSFNTSELPSGIYAYNLLSNN